MRGFIDYFDDPRVVEIMLNGDKSLWIERVGEGMVDTGRRIEPVDAERFISIVLREQTDYTKWRHQFFGNMSDNEIEADIDDFVKSHPNAFE